MTIQAGRKRRTRREMQQDTRARLLEAAFHIIAESGVAAASIRGVCERAGFSQGAFYSNFASKDELLLVLMERYMSEIATVLDGAVDQASDRSLEESLRGIATRLAELARRPVLSLLAIELQIHALRDPVFAAHFERVKAAYHREFAQVIAKVIEHYQLRSLIPPLQLSIALHALWSGSIVQATSADALPVEDLIMLMFKTATGCDVRSPSGK